MVQSSSFTEIEHKFLVTSDFDASSFFKKISSLSPAKLEKIRVRDVYYVLNSNAKHVFRHRYDDQIQQLTVKSVEEDSSVRTEINLPIDQSKGDQSPAVSAFMKVLGCKWSAEIAKDIEVAYFPDCEIVFYRAVGKSNAVNCIEFEAVNPKSVADGLRVLSHYEAALGFNSKDRESKSLFELLLPQDAPEDVKKMFR